MIDKGVITAFFFMSMSILAILTVLYYFGMALSIEFNPWMN